MAIDICLPLVKYSYAIGCDNKTNTIPWEHLSAVDLFVVIKGEGSNDATGPLIMNIIHATKVLERVDINRYIQRAIEARAAIERQNTTASIEQLPIFGITKDNLLALRYRLKDGQDHRTQLRMQSTADCRQIVDLFQWRGMEFREANARPGTSRSSVRPSTAQSDFRPLTAQSSSPYFSQGQSTHARPSTTHGQAPAPDGPIQQSRRVEKMQPDNGFRASPASQDMPPPRIIKRGERTAPGELAIERPSTAQMWRTRTAPNQPSGMAGTAPQFGQSGPVNARPSSYNNIENVEAIRQAVEEDTDPTNAHLTGGVPSLQQQDSTGALDAYHYLSPSSDVPRPVTAASATSLALPDTQDVEIAMKHELVSNLPRSRHSGSSSRPSSALDLPPLKKPQVEKRPSTVVEDWTTTPTPDGRGTWATTTAVQKRPATDADTSFYTPDDVTEPRKVIFTKQTQPPMAPQAVLPGNPTVDVDEALPMDELLRRSREDRGLKEPARRRHSSLADAPHEFESPPPPPGQAAEASRKSFPPNETAPQREIGRRFGQDVSNASRNAPREDRSLDDFAAQRPEDRQVALDDFMIENLENPSFTTLCEDVENCWRRIALGL